MESGWWDRMLSSTWLQGFILYSVFRAIYGAIILIVTYFLATNESTPWWTSVIFLLISMAFSRLLFKLIKSRLDQTNAKSIENEPENFKIG
tara:strand:+ start:5482 stop:5754 length:273 start_codon:yes stop_codon:yes gene_type:complete